jgi:hypothetical protein
VRQSDRAISFNAGEDERTKLPAVFEISARGSTISGSLKRRGLTTQATEEVPMAR